MFTPYTTSSTCKNFGITTNQLSHLNNIRKLCESDTLPHENVKCFTKGDQIKYFSYFT